MNLSKEKAIKLLKNIYKMAADSSMTGSLVDGADVLITNYHKIRDIAITNGWVDADWIVELKIGELLNGDSESMDVVGVAAKLFIVQLEDEEHIVSEN
jgi:hypothetical protein